MSMSLTSGLRWLHAAALFVFVAALCLAVAVLAIAFIPGSPVSQDLPEAALSGLHRAGGVVAGVVPDPSGWSPFQIEDPSPAQRLLHMLTEVPGLVLVAEIGRRMARLVRGAQDGDPFTTESAEALATLGKLTAFAGLGTWMLSQVGQGLLCTTMLSSSFTFRPQATPLAWLAVGLIFAAFGRILGRGVAMRAELDTLI
ncbi:hypothetical protein [Pedococcus sp. 5OH_020]|uniref:hypothetical protein n=1 Tax=Pedococcus sp. 5OH_020 TaxID=2989814 RepID=UPI0022E99B79|nr:hypothetical protein [Pedococcus sp. 5OH_020]